MVEETEKELASVDGIEKSFTTIRSGFAGIRVELKTSLREDSDISRAWDEVEEALERAEKVFPAGAFSPSLDRKLDQEAMLISIDADDEIRHDVLLELENELLKNSKVSRIRRIGDEGRQISIGVIESKLANSGISITQLLGQIGLANTQMVSGFIEIDDKRVNIQTSNSFEKLEEFKTFPIAITNGNTVPLSNLANVSLEEKSPASEEMRWNGKKVYGLGVISRKGIDLRTLGSSVNESIQFVLNKYTNIGINLKIEIINSQPEYVQARLVDLSYSLISSIGLLSIFMILFMGIRVGLIVSLMFPIISLISFGFYAISGGILHQIAIAAFVLSFGILIDNIVVIVESIQEKLNAGVDNLESGIQTIQEFASPLLSSTVTTVAAFIPMALAKDVSAEFTGSIPRIVIISISVSYIASIVLSPSLSLKFLKPMEKNISVGYLNQLGIGIANFVIKKPKLLGLILIVFFVSIIFCFPFLKFKFFPSADRNQIILELSFPEGTSYSKTLQSVKDFESKIIGKEDLKGIASFIGRSTAFFYYNLPQKPNAPHLAQILLVSSGDSFPEKLKKEIFEEAQKIGAQIRLKTLEQGPPVEASIVLRVYHSDRELWKNKIQELIGNVSKLNGVQLAWSDSIGTQQKIFFAIDDNKLIQYGSNRRDVSLALLKSTYGLSAGYFKTGLESIPISVTSRDKEKTSVKDLENTVVYQVPEKSILSKNISNQTKEYSEAVHHLYNRKSYVSMLVDLEKNINPKESILTIKSFLKVNGLKENIDFEFDGEQGKSDESNIALLQSMPIGMTILLATLIWEFNSYRLLLLILTTVPTAFLGLIPGLVISGQPFGFLPLLALFALIGIAVNNGIILIDKFESSFKEGILIEEAIRNGVAERLRPILLTSGSTILGMIPLGFSSSTLWPPFAWAMVSGLFISTVTTLFIIPSLYLWVFKKREVHKKILISLIFLFIPNLLFSENSIGKKISFEETLELAKDSPVAKAAYYDAAKAKAVNNEAKKATYFPKLGTYVERVQRDKNLFIDTPIGESRFGNKEFTQTGLEIYQSIWNGKNIDGFIPATKNLLDSANKKAIWETKSAMFYAANSYIDCAILKIRNKISEERILNLKQLINESERLLKNGKIREIELLKLERGYGDLERGKEELANIQNTCASELARVLGKEELVEVDFEKIPKVSFNDSIQLEREDLQSFRLKIEALKKELVAIKSDALPEVYAKGNLIYSDQANLTPLNYSQISVGAKWSIFDGGIRNEKVNQKEKEILSLQELFKDATKKMEVSKLEWKNRETSKKNQILNLDKELLSMQKRLNSERLRLLTGRNSSSFYFQMQDIYFEVLEKKNITLWELFRTQIASRYVNGNFQIAIESKDLK